MRWFNKSRQSLESWLSWRLALLVALSLSLAVALAWQLNASFWLLTMAVGLLLVLSCALASQIKAKVLTSFNRAALHVDAINQEDYHQYGKAAFAGGLVAEFHQQLNVLSRQLQEKKSRYDQHVFLVYQLIAQLDTPVLVFNEQQQLSLGNQAFSLLFKQPWQMLRHASPKLLGLTFTGQQWQFIEPDYQQRWQIRHSSFIDGGKAHQLLIFIDIESALRANQLSAWQQIIRVLSHEIRNSLAPVSSMAELLADKTQDQRERQKLQMITERCNHLQTFVNRYVTLSKQLAVQCQWLAVAPLVQSLQQLFSPKVIDAELKVEKIWGDVTLLQQVLINLVKNAFEANAEHLSIRVSEQAEQFMITLIDDGQGFSNLDNAFVPLYSTKADGQGIGLTFCRNLIEQHQGSIDITNNATHGVTVSIALPKPSH